MAPRKRGKTNNDEENLSESMRLLLQNQVTQFVNSNEEEMEFLGLDKEHRKYIHKFALQFALKSHSHGKGKSRVLRLTRRKPKAAMGDLRLLTLGDTTRRLLIEMEPTIQAHLSMNYDSFRNSFVSYHSKRQKNETLQLSLNKHMIPPPPKCISDELMRDRQELPMFQYKNELYKMLQQHSVFIVNGETGSGKTTQVPQYILEEATLNNKPCRIVVSQPRRVGAVSISCRVAEERGEQLGETVGYQIRMESRVRKTTNLIYTTSGCLLRSIMAGTQEFFSKVTHLIIDEIHERDKYTDFALITIKEQLRCNKKLKVILMSATMDIDLLSNYFDNCPILNVPGQGYDIKIYHLEDILFYTGYRTSLMEKYLRSMNEMELLSPAPPLITAPTMLAPILNVESPDQLCSEEKNIQYTLNSLLDQFECDFVRKEEDICEMFDQIQYLIESESMPVDTAHSVNGLTPLMAACKYNCPPYAQLFLERKANPDITDIRGLTAYDYADEHVDGVCGRVLRGLCGDLPAQFNEQEKTRQMLLKAYQKQFNDDYDVDHDLILSLLEGLYRSPHPGAIMVFLPGYNDIVQQRDLIVSTLPIGTYRICILHGQMDSRDQYEALQPLLIRKIILSTNIGQTSITIPDLAYIIDSGKVKMNMFDMTTESSQLQSVWISQADACQRAGRAGRTQNGVCYRLYSKMKYHYMPAFCIPEFLRIPLTEICLYAKTLAPQYDVQSYLSRALNPPSEMNVRSAIKKLQILEVFNMDETVTDLGRHLVDIPLDVHLGKCLLYSVFFKCFDPVLTIVSFHSVKDPFIIPADRTAQGQASFQRKQLAGESFSDQMGILELYRGYTAARNNRKRATEFCNKYALSYSAMEVFCATRRQIADVVASKFRLGPQATVLNQDWNMVRMCLAAGFYPNVAFIDRERNSLLSGAEKQLILQRSSALNPPGKKHLKEFIKDFPHDWIVFYEKSRLSNTCAINMNTVLPSIFVALQCGRECKIMLDPDQSDESNEASGEEDVDEIANSCGSELHNGNSEFKLLNSLNAMAVTSSDKMAIMALDNWIKFNLNTSDADLLNTFRRLVRLQFDIFLRKGHIPEIASASFLVQKLLHTLDEPDFGKASTSAAAKRKS